MVIDEKLINYLEDLSFLSLSAEEKGRICTDLEKILAGMDLLSTLDTSGVSDQALKHKTELRKDEVTASFFRDEILRNAPEANGETFVVPKAVE